MVFGDSVGTATVTTQGPRCWLRHDAKGGDFYLATSGDLDLATSGDLDLATSGDFFMATDTVAKRVKRMAITEGGPYDSRSGKWDPAALERAARAQKRAPLWSMLWFDDANGRKQLSSLRGGDAWLDSCPNAFCLLR